MTTALQFSIYDMCHCYNNLNSTHTLNIIVYFCHFGLQFELLQQTQMRWPSWFQDLESYQPMGGGLSLVQLTNDSHLMLIRTYQIDQTITSNHMQYNAWGVRDIDGYGCFVFEKDPSSVGPGVFNWSGFTASATTPCSSGSIIRSSNQSSIISPVMITVLCNFHSRGGDRKSVV